MQLQRRSTSTNLFAHTFTCAGSHVNLETVLFVCVRDLCMWLLTLFAYQWPFLNFVWIKQGGDTHTRTLQQTLNYYLLSRRRFLWLWIMTLDSPLLLVNVDACVRGGGVVANTSEQFCIKELVSCSNSMNVGIMPLIAFSSWTRQDHSPSCILWFHDASRVSYP